MKSVVLIILIWLCSSIATEPLRSIQVTIDNIVSDEGDIYIYLYNYSKQFPYHPYKHFKVDKSKVEGNTLKYNLGKYKIGKYAISTIDDENGNQDLDRVANIPLEGFGFSNNIKTFKLPKYDALLFENTKNIEVQITMQYALPKHSKK